MKIVLYIGVVSVLCHSAKAQIIFSNDVQNFLNSSLTSLESIASNNALVDPDTGLTIEQFLAKYNYPLESHNVTTSDGYILTMHRIPNGKGGSTTTTATSKPVVLLVHGLGCGSWYWVCFGPDKSLALLLADLGYDIWIANLRGTTYSYHQTLTRDDSGFWDYTFHERGTLDLPAVIDYILSSTTVTTITYVGHSEGSTNGYVLTSSLPAYNAKLNLMVSFSPLAYMGNATSPFLRILSANREVVKILTDLLGIQGVPELPLFSALVDVFCNDYSAVQPLCQLIEGTQYGFDIGQENKTKITVMYSHIPAGFSFKELQHYLQEIDSGEFRQYDYGSIQNLIVYGSTTPPSYDVTKITVPTAFYYAQNDFVSSNLDVEKLLAQLTGTTIADHYLNSYIYFNHMDYLMAKDVVTLLYNRVIPVIESHNPI